MQTSVNRGLNGTLCGVWGNMFEPWGMQKSAVNTNSKIQTVSAQDRFQNVETGITGHLCIKHTCE